ncbi:MAG TPA: ABC transporter substrate-binding protein [Casimicrobiaceae bacterium]|nr:ABC transporter substrate-binding protein [Casimicrobiaceae bacterium]
MTVIGLLDAGERREWWDALRQRLRGLGYVEGRNVSFESRYAKGKMDALNALADELARLEVAVIVTSSSAAAVAAARATRKIPIVIASGGDQVGRGLASSLTRPKGNVTGVTSLSSDLMAKRLEQLREVAPKSTRLAALWHADNSSTASVRELDLAASRARLAFQSVGFKDAAELTETFAAMARDRIDALVVIQSALVHAERKRIAALADKHKLPAIYGSAEFADAGGLLAYGPSYPDMFRRAAHYVDKILKGAIPGELPIEQPTTFELVINASAARRLGVDVPPQLLARASRVIQ